MKVKDINNKIAEKMTNGFQSMACFWIFCVYGLLPLVKVLNPYMNQFLYWSNYIQLISLPLLAVGQMILDKASEQRVNEMYDMIKEEFDIAKDERDELNSILSDVKTLVKS